jgi:DNA-binding beta-propeller fold protein YncE
VLGCGSRASNTTLTTVAGDIADVPSPDTGSTTAEPLVLGPPVQVIDSLPHPTSVTVGPDDRYYVVVRDSTIAMVAVEPTNGTRTTYNHPAIPPGAGSGVARDRDGRVYVADSVDSSILVVDPADVGRGKPRPILTGLNQPTDVAVDPVRDRLLVLETNSNRLSIYDLP